MTELQTLEKERGALAQELAGIAALLADGQANVNALEAALTRKAALEQRAKAVDARLQGERAKLAQAEAEKRKQEAERLKAEAGALMAQAADALLDVLPLCAQHGAAMAKVAALTGASAGMDRRGANLHATINSALQMLQPGRFYPIDAAGTLADRQKARK